MTALPPCVALFATNVLFVMFTTPFVFMIAPPLAVEFAWNVLLVMFPPPLE